MQNETYVGRASHECPTAWYVVIEYEAVEDGEIYDCACCKATVHVPCRFAAVFIEPFVQEAPHHGSVVSLLAANMVLLI